MSESFKQMLDEAHKEGSRILDKIANTIDGEPTGATMLALISTIGSICAETGFSGELALKLLSESIKVCQLRREKESNHE